MEQFSSLLVPVPEATEILMLPGSELKFVPFSVNGENMLQVVDDEVYLRKNIDNCLTCGCYGLRHEFFRPNYCVEACFMSSSQYSLMCEEAQQQNAPIKLFKQPALPSETNPFQIGQLLEAIDPENQSLFCVVSISDVVGWRLELHFEGYASQFDFWVNADSLDIFPIGWCEKNGYKLQPPGNMKEDFTWPKYLDFKGQEAAPVKNFHIFKEEFESQEVDIVGMKLEAVDIRATSLIICVATVTKVLGHRFLIHFDSWDNIYDYWADFSSPFIFPVGYCTETGFTLTPPNDYVNFEWSKYMKETKSEPLPESLFRPLPPVGFKKGMRIEAVDLKNPRLVRPAIIQTTDSHVITVRYEGWSESLDTRFSELSSDIHPIGYCEQTGHPLEILPVTNSKHKGQICPYLCNGKGNANDCKKLFHSNKTECPYLAPKNKTERVVIVFPGGTSGPSAVVTPPTSTTIMSMTAISSQPSNYSPSNTNSESNGSSQYCSEASNSPAGSTSRHFHRSYKKSKKDVKSAIEIVMSSLAIKVLQEKRVELDDDSYLFETLLKNVTIADIRSWNCEQVSKFVATIPGCETLSDTIKDQIIDGDALLLLTRNDMIEISTLGQGIKVYYALDVVRNNNCDLSNSIPISGSIEMDFS